MIEHFHAECDTLKDILARSPIIGQKGAQIGANSKNATAHSLLHTQQEADYLIMFIIVVNWRRRRSGLVIIITSSLLVVCIYIFIHQ